MTSFFAPILPAASSRMLISFLAISLPARGAPWDGNGTAEFPYLIYDADDMQAIGADSDYWLSHFKLMDDIDLSAYTGTQFNLIGYSNHYNDEKAFRGQFDGGGHVIRNFSYTSTKSKVGLFGYVGHEAKIQNLGLENAYVKGIQYVGALAGESFGRVSNCFAIGTIEGSSYVGGLVGANIGVMSACYSESSVSGNSAVGGLAGYNDYSVISDCYATGDVTATQDSAGGLVGSNYGAQVLYSYAVGSVSGSSNVGALVGFETDGYSEESLYVSCFWDSTLMSSIPFLKYSSGA